MSMALIQTVVIIAAFLSAFTGALGQYFVPNGELNLCDKRPGVEPNGMHLPYPNSSQIVYTNWTNNSPSKVNHCLMRFTTCEKCRLHVTAENSFHYSKCHSPEASREYDGWCVPGCSYLHLYDRFYSNLTAATYSSSSSSGSDGFRMLDFRTESRILYVIACANRTTDREVFFQIRINAEDKKQNFYGAPWGVSGPRVFSSPFFPSEYVLNSEVYTYVFQAATEDEFVTITFDDWQLSQYSSILFDSANINGKIWGTNYRPWIISDSNRLEMTFDTGPYKIPGTQRAFKGFRATYAFHKGERENVPYVHTNCGWWIDRQKSGMITFNPTANGLDYYDCIWVIKRYPGFQRVFVKVVNYSTRDHTYRRNQPNVLEIRDGITSRGQLVESAVPSTSSDDIQIFQDHDSDVGFYVRLKGHYSGQRDFVLTFTSFNLDFSCRDLFKCYNGRCIPLEVTCDGIDNCGDNSDEAYGTCGGSTSPGGPERGSTVSVGIIIPMVVSAFLIIVICLLILFIRRCRRLSCQARRAQNRQQHINTVSGTVSRQQRRHNRRRGEHRSGSGGGQLYDPPPSYEDVLNTTPIGYLNLGYSDSSYNATGLIQPPSYDEAVSPTSPSSNMTFQTSLSQNLSSDSSSAETVGCSQLNLSSSYSSDDTQMREGQNQNHNRVVSSSSDSSTESREVMSGPMDNQRREGRRGGGHGSRVDGQPREARAPNNRHSLAKPEDTCIQLPVSSSADISDGKSSKSENKPSDRQDNNRDNPTIITEGMASTNGAGSLSDQTSRERTQQPSSACRSETSPRTSVSSPTSVCEHQGREQNTADFDNVDGGASSLDVSRGACSLSPTSTIPNPQSLGRYHTSEDASPARQLETSPDRQHQHNQPKPGKKIPTHIWKAKNPSSDHLLKHLSRSLNDLSLHSNEGRSDQDHSCMPSRQFSQSVHNLYDTEDPHLPLTFHHHHQSQSLPAAQGSSSETYTPYRRDVPPDRDRRDRRNKSEDLGCRTDARTEYPHRYPEPLPRGQSRPQILPKERNRSQDGDESVQQRTRAKPEPRPRQSRQSMERTHPDHQHRPCSQDRAEGHLQQPKSPQRSEYMNGAQPLAQGQQPPSYSHSLDRQRMNMDHTDRNRAREYPRRNGHSLERNQHAGRGYPDSNEIIGRQGLADGQERRHHQAVTPEGRPRPPKPEIIPRSYYSQAKKQSADSESRYQASRNEEPRSPTRDHESRPNFRRPGPPPYRPHNSNRPHRPSDLSMSSVSSEQSRMHGPGTSNQNSNSLSPRSEHAPPSKSARMPRPTGSPGRMPTMDVHSAARSGKSGESGGNAGSGEVKKEAESLYRNAGASPYTSSHSNPASPLSDLPNVSAPLNELSPNSLSEQRGSFTQDLSPQSSSNEATGSPCKPPHHSPARSAPDMPVSHSLLSGSKVQLAASKHHGSNHSMNSRPDADAVMDTDSSVRMEPSSSNAGSVPFLSLHMDGEGEAEDIYV